MFQGSLKESVYQKVLF